VLSTPDIQRQISTAIPGIVQWSKQRWASCGSQRRGPTDRLAASTSIKASRLDSGNQRPLLTVGTGCKTLTLDIARTLAMRLNDIGSKQHGYEEKRKPD
jgi:hypothetical protein